MGALHVCCVLNISARCARRMRFGAACGDGVEGLSALFIYL